MQLSLGGTRGNIYNIKLIVAFAAFAYVRGGMHSAICRDRKSRVSVSALRSYRALNSFLLVALSRLLSHEWDSFRFFLPFASASYRYRGPAKATLASLSLSLSALPRRPRQLDQAKLLKLLPRHPFIRFRAAVTVPRAMRTEARRRFARSWSSSCAARLHSESSIGPLSRHALRFPTSPRPSQRIRPRMYEQFGRVRSIWPEPSGTNR